MITQENIPYTADEIKAMVKTCEKYNNALNKAKELMNKGYDVLMPEIFSELQEQESEDERIRKAIIDFLGLPHLQFVGKRNHEKWIAWLEKQGEKLDVDKVIEWLRYHIQVDEPKIEYNEDGQPLAESFIAHAKARCMAADEVIEQFKKDFRL